MALCRDCLHLDVCKTTDSCDGHVPRCKHFKDKAKYAEVVRCKDCKHCSHSGLCNLYLNVSHEMKSDDFCSYGERRKDG